MWVQHPPTCSPLRASHATRICASRRAGKVQAGLIIPSKDEMEALMGTASQPPTALPRRSLATRAILATKPGAIVTRRAFDVGVVGDNLTAYLTAYNLAQQGLRVALLGAAPMDDPPGGALWNPEHSPLIAPCTDPHTTLCVPICCISNFTHTAVLRLSHVGTRMWGSLASAHQPSILHTHGCVLTTSRPGDPAAPLVELLHSVCQEAGVPASLLPGGEVDALVPWLRLRRGVAWALSDPSSAILMHRGALQVLRALALRSGVVVYDTAVIGWRQHFSGHMELRHASPTMRRWGESAVAECGQLVLAPEAWAPEQLAWFGLGAAEEAGWAAAAWDGENSFDKDDQSEPVKPMATDLTTQAASQPAVLGLQSVAATQLQCGNPSDSARLLASPCAALLDVRNWVDGEGPGRCVMVPLGGGGTAPAGMQVQQWVADGLACTAGDGGLVGDHSRAGQVLRTTYQQVVRNPAPDMDAGPMVLWTASADGAPLLGSHPGFEAQQVVICVPACGGASGSVCGAAAVPLLSACAAALVTGRPPPADADLQRLDPTRPSVSMAAAAMTVDSWEAWHAQRLQAAMLAEVAAAEAQQRAMDEQSSFREQWLPGKLLKGLQP